MTRLSVLLSIALIVAVVGPRCVAGTEYTFNLIPTSPLVCSVVGLAPAECDSDVVTWSDSRHADVVDGSSAQVVLSQTGHCSEQLRCQELTLPAEYSTWSDVTVDTVTVGFQYDFRRTGRVAIGLISVSGTVSPQEEFDVIEAGADDHTMPTTMYGLSPGPISALTDQFGVYAWIERVSGPGTGGHSFDIDGFFLALHASGDATISGVSPSDDVPPGQDITIEGEFFDTTAVGYVAMCRFRPHGVVGGAVLASSVVTSITTTEVVCSVPAELGDQPDMFDVTVTLDVTQDEISPGTVLHYQPDGTAGETDDERNDKPKAAFDVPLPVLAASGAGVAVLGIAGAVVMMRRNSRGGASDGDTVDGKSAMSLSSSTAVGASASATGTTTATTATTASGVSATSARGNSTHDTAAVAGAAGAGRRPSKQRRPSHKGRVQRGTSTPLRPAAGKKGAAFETTPVSAFGPARSSMRTAYSVTSEQAPYFDS